MRHENRYSYLPSFGALAREFGENHRLFGVLLLVLLAARLHEKGVRGHSAARLGGVLGATAGLDDGRLHLYVLVGLLMRLDLLLMVLLQVLVLGNEEEDT